MFILWREFFCAKYFVAFVEVLLLDFHVETSGKLHPKMLTLGLTNPLPWILSLVYQLFNANTIARLWQYANFPG